MNLYAYAGNNPVAFSDPLGLCPWCERKAQQLANWGARRGGVAGAVALNAGAALAAGLEASGVNDLFRGGQALSEGRVASGLFLIGTSLPGGGKAGKVAGGFPPWHTESLLAGAWLGLVPLALILLGVGRAAGRVSSGSADGIALAAGTVILYLVALLWVSLEVPIYSTMKASYTLGLLPCYGVLAAAGFDALPRRAWLRVPVAAGLASWAVFAYVAYFAHG